MPRLSEAVPAASPSAEEFSPEQRRALLRLAHLAILAAVDGQTFSAGGLEPHLSEALFHQTRGVFTTLHLAGQLRGCVGYPVPAKPLYRAVAETAVAAALEDTRFPPVTKDEAAALEVSLSVLSNLFPIAAAAVEVGRHGLVITHGTHRGLLLPQVPVEHGWDRETFLDHTCRKAGLPRDAWRGGATIEAFTAEVFSDAD